MHPTKVERHDTHAKQHHTNTGIRKVDVYHSHGSGLYVARAFDRHPEIAYWQAHLLPRQHVVICKYTLHQGSRPFDYYLDIAQITEQDGIWTVRDLYLDLIIADGLHAQILDTEEFTAAWRLGYISAEDMCWALEQAHEVINALAQHGYHLAAWLASCDVHLHWLVNDSHAQDCIGV